MPAYYNELDPYAAAWLRNLIAAGHIAPGDVDERDIREVQAGDLAGYTQCHFFAGVGVWSHALRRAGWDDSRPVWTGSCPCQPFSSAGRGGGFDDERHLWPHWFSLIRECRPAVVFGEQVEAAIRYGWLDLVQDDMEGCGYAFGAVGIPAAGVGAPHIRQRLWWVADAQRDTGGARGLAEQSREGFGAQGAGPSVELGRCSVLSVVGNATGDGQRQSWLADQSREQPQPLRRPSVPSDVGDPGSAGLARPSRQSGDDGAERASAERAGGAVSPLADHGSEGRRQVGAHVGGGGEGSRAPGLDERPAHRSPWSDAEWIPCRDGKFRPVEPGTFPLAHGAPARVGRLRAYGNAIVAQAAEEFIRAYTDPTF